MKKIGFVICKSELSNWNGGISYYRNIINLIKDTQDITIFTDNSKFISSFLTFDTTFFSRSTSVKSNFPSIDFAIFSA